MIKPVTRKSGTVWQAYGRKDGKNCYIGSFTTEAQALEAVEDHRVTQRQIARGELPPETDRRRTLDESLDEWIRSYRKRSKSIYRKRVDRYVRPWFKQTPLVRVTPAMVEDFQTWLLTVRKLHPGTVNGVVLCLSSAFTYFMKVKRWVPENPARSVELLEEPKKQYNWIKSRDEQVKLLAHCEDPLRPMLATFLMTGMRLDELTNLHWTDVDLTLRLITIQRGSKGTTKSGEERTVPINNSLLSILKAWRLQKGTSPLVFPGRDGQVRHPSSVRVPYKRALKRAGLDQTLRVHDLRHTYASHYLREGGSIFRLSRYLGHSSVKVTERVYSHMVPKDYEQDWERNCLELGAGEVVDLRPAQDKRKTNPAAAELKMATA